MDALARHIAQAHADAAQVTTSARKIADRFDKIEHVQVGTDTAEAVEGASPLEVTAKDS